MTQVKMRIKRSKLRKILPLKKKRKKKARPPKQPMKKIRAMLSKARLNLSLS